MSQRSRFVFLSVASWILVLNEKLQSTGKDSDNMEERAPKKTLLNRGALAKIAEATTKRRLQSSGQARDVLSLCTLNREFNRAVLRQIEACDAVRYNEFDVALCHAKGELNLDYTLFAELCAANNLAFPKVILASGRVRLSNIKLTGVEQLSMYNPRAYAMGRLLVLQLLSIIEDNKRTLKALLRMPKALFDCLPEELELEKFSVAEDVPLDDLKIPALNTKIFECVDVQHSTPTPASFMRTLGADEIHLKAVRIKPSEHVLGDAPNNARVKKLSVTLGNEQRVNVVELSRILRDTAACFPRLECFELLHDVNTEVDPLRLHQFIKYVDHIVACFERVLERAHAVHFRVQVITKLCCRTDKLPSKPVASDFACGLHAEPLPGISPPDKNYFRFVKESSVRGHVLRVECMILQRPQSSDNSDDEEPMQ